MKHDIKNILDVRLLVDSFYNKVRKDPKIGKLFNDKIQDWDTHLEKMYRFWQTVLLNEHTYQGSPFPLHAPLQIEKNHFDRWTFLWNETVDRYFEGIIANEAKWRGDKMATMFLSKIEYFKNNNIKPIL
ncbi:group III truncated hemoglobin [Chryseobacterium sp.]|uniref:group III truncated hemoglobin n=1 Tax=Chryseobacterium sp. TaxID=1871047 RepID=UPI00289EA686|nr:group III truncated hemoglobin [Chryseobacterium sp.]